LVAKLEQLVLAARLEPQVKQERLAVTAYKAMSARQVATERQAQPDKSVKPALSGCKEIKV